MGYSIVILENNFTKDDEANFLISYKDDLDNKKIEIYKNIQDVLWTVWTLVKLNDNNKIEYLDYARKRLNRALKNKIC